MELKKILIIDDSKEFIFLTRMTLKGYDMTCEIEEVHNGQEALDLLDKTTECPQIILLDLSMPIMAGLEFLREYEARDKCRDNTLIYIMTSSVLEQDKINSLSFTSVRGYFEKPVTKACIDEMLKAVTEHTPVKFMRAINKNIE